MTTRTAHTPGPWKISHHGQIVACDVRETMISTVISDRDGALIAAAPELLEALKASQDWLEEALASEPEDFENTNLIVRIKTNEQAIKKAEGRSL